MYNIRGSIKEINQETIKNDNGEWLKMTFVIEQTGDFKNIYQFEIFGEESINLHKNAIKEGRVVDVDFYIKCREYKGRYYNTLVAKEVRYTNVNDMENERFAVKMNNGSMKDLPF